MTIIYHGWTPQTPKHEQIANGIASCKAFLQRDPQNAYWRRKLEALEQERILDNLTPEAHEEYIANLVHSAYGEALEDDPQRDADLLNAEIEKNGWYELPPVTTWKQAMEKRERDFNRRYYNNPDGKPEFKYG